MNTRFLSLLLAASAVQAAHADTNKTLIDFFKPMEPKGELVSTDIWGVDDVLPRDIKNGLEDATVENWCYWDGKIVKDDAGKYHMYASRWPQSVSHGVGWNTKSTGMHAVSDDLLGPYIDQGATWPHWNDGIGHNVIGLRMQDGRYAMISSEVSPGDVFVSETPYGPWSHRGELKIDNNGFYRGLARYDELDQGAVRAGTVGHMANVMVINRPDGRYMIVARHCATMISDDGILGPYRIMTDKAWRGIEGLPQYKMEDPTVWYSDGLYHIVVNCYAGNFDVTYHLTSDDGIHNWSNRGLAFNQERGIFKYTNGVQNRWYTVQRPTVYTEDELVKAFNFSVIDVHKGHDGPNDNHASKIVIVPFDGEGFNQHIREIVDTEHQMMDATLPPAPWKSLDIGKVAQKGNTGYDSTHETFRVKATGNAMDQQEDACRYVYQKLSGDISATVLVMAQDITTAPIQAGLMFRQDLSADASFAFASISNQDGFSIDTRTQRGAISEKNFSQELKAPYWIRMEKRGDTLRVYSSPSNEYNWTKLSEVSVPLGDNFYVGMAASSIDNGAHSLARFKGVDIHPWGQPINEGIVNHTFSNTIPRSGKITFEIDYEALQTMDIFVELQNVETTVKFKALRQRLKNKGTVELTYDVGQELQSGDMYWFVLKTIPMHGHENSAIQSTFKKVFVE